MLIAILSGIVLIFVSTIFLHFKTKKAMSNIATSMTELAAAFAAETDRLAAKVDQALAILSNDAREQAEEAEALGKLTQVKNRLAQLGTDPADPIPDEEPVTDPQA